MIDRILRSNKTLVALLLFGVTLIGWMFYTATDGNVPLALGLFIFATFGYFVAAGLAFAVTQIVRGIWEWLGG